MLFFMLSLYFDVSILLHRDCFLFSMLNAEVDRNSLKFTDNFVKC